MPEFRQPDEKVERLMALIKDEMEKLPPYNAFGGSNAGTVAESARMIGELGYYLSTGHIQWPETEVGLWLAGEDNTLEEDYGIE